MYCFLLIAERFTHILICCPRLHCLFHGVWMPLYSFSRKTVIFQQIADKSMTTMYMASLSPPSFSVPLFSQIWPIKGALVNLGALFNNTDPEPYPKDASLDCLGICLSMFVCKHPLVSLFIRQVWETLSFYNSGT